MKSNIHTTRSGFTLIETLVAISILLIAVVGPMVLVSNGIKISYFARDQITAVYLAQDAMEALRFIRDSELQNLSSAPTNLNSTVIGQSRLGQNGTNGCYNPVSFSNKCRIDTLKLYDEASANAALNASVIDDAVDPDENVKLKEEDGFYQYTSGTDTSFERYVSLKTANGKLGYDVAVTIKWMYGSTPREYTVYNTLYYYK